MSEGHLIVGGGKPQRVWQNDRRTPGQRAMQMPPDTQQPGDCECLKGDFYYLNFETKSLGADSNYGEASIDRCKRCGRFWLPHGIRIFDRGRAMVSRTHDPGNCRLCQCPICNQDSRKPAMVFSRRQRLRRQGHSHFSRATEILPDSIPRLISK